MHRALVPASSVLFATTVTAQAERFTAHPQDVPHVGTGQLTPMSDVQQGCEGRSQLLLRARHLPGPGARLLAVEFNASSQGPVTYESLELTLSPVAPGTFRSLTFANNLPQPTTIVQLANTTISWTGTGWQRLVLAAPFVHDGFSDLTLDIQKDAAAGFGNGGLSGLFRPDLETMLVAFGPASSGMHQANGAQFQVLPVDLRLVWDDAPTSRLRSPIPGPNHHGFAVGSTLDHVVTAPPGSLCALAGDLQWSQPVSLPFAIGAWRAQGVVLGLDVVAANGEAVRTYPIPGSTTFVGQQLVYQALVLDAVTATFQFTNGSDCFLGQ